MQEKKQHPSAYFLVDQILMFVQCNSLIFNDQVIYLVKICKEGLCLDTYIYLNIPWGKLFGQLVFFNITVHCTQLS